jgi:hypothetical protein
MRSRRLWSPRTSPLAYFQSNVTTYIADQSTSNASTLPSIISSSTRHKIHNSHVTFTPHPKSLEETLPPSKEQQKQFGFCDINFALINILEAIQNAPNNQRKKPRAEKEVDHHQIQSRIEDRVEEGVESRAYNRIQGRIGNPKRRHHHHCKHLRQKTQLQSARSSEKANDRILQEYLKGTHW